MNLVDMTQENDCFSAVLATLMQRPREWVPNFFEMAEDDSDEAWSAAVGEFLASHGLGIASMKANEHSLALPGYLIVSGPSPRHPELWHATIWRDGALLHDPHPSRDGVEPCIVEVLYKLEPWT